jgi:hypothetical protein
LRPRLKVVWRSSALRDLGQRAQWSQRQAQRVFDDMNQMAAGGWRLGRDSIRYPGFKYWQVSPLAVLYRVKGNELRVARVFHMSQVHELP